MCFNLSPVPIIREEPEAEKFVASATFNIFTMYVDCFFTIGLSLSSLRVECLVIPYLWY